MAAKGLPADVWLWIIEHHMSGTESANLASTNKSLRDLALPILFKTLTFELDLKAGIKVFKYNLNRAQRRAESLLKCSHLLQHVRSFQLSQWNTKALSPACGAVTDLLLALPRIQALDLYKCNLTKELYSFVVHNTLLISLNITNCTLQNTTISEDSERTVMRLTHLTFDQDYIARNIPIPSFKQLLEGCWSSLTSLKITASHIPHFVSSIGDNLVALRHLVILYVREYQASSDVMRKLLVSCTELRRLEISPDVAFHLGTLPRDALPKLEYLSASREVLAVLVPGRSVSEIFLFNGYSGPTPHEQLDTLRQSAVPIESFSVTMYETLKRQISHLRRSDAFVNLTYLCLALTSMAVTSRLVLEDERQYLISSISSWPQLRHCYMSVASNWVDIDHAFTVEDVECPVGLRENPRRRGHPSLENIQLISRFFWVWVPRGGWTCTESFDFAPLEQEDVW